MRRTAVSGVSVISNEFPRCAVWKSESVRPTILTRVVQLWDAIMARGTGLASLSTLCGDRERWARDRDWCESGTCQLHDDHARWWIQG